MGEKAEIKLKGESESKRFMDMSICQGACQL